MNQELTDLEESYTSRRATLEGKVADLGRQVTQRRADLEKTEAQIEEEWRNLQARRENVSQQNKGDNEKI